MNDECTLYRDKIAKSFLRDLAPVEQEALERHLAGCPVCAEENSAYADLLQQMKAIEDEPVPRHFFVYPKERSLSLWSLVRMLHPAWQAVAAGVLMVVALLPMLAFSRLHVRSENGAWTIAFHEITPPAPAQPQAAIDTTAVEARIVKIIEEKNRKEGLEWVRTLRSEIRRSQQSITPQQKLILETALSNLETRMGNRLENTARLIIDQNERSISGVYQTVAKQRERDLTAIEGRFNQLAVNSEIKSTQTDAILETILQVAELRGR